MQVLHDIPQLGSLTGPLVIAAGVFDGMHHGHQAVLRTALQAAASANGMALALTFDPHPSKILRPQSAVRLLTSTPHKLRLMEELGMPAVLVVPFNEEFAALEAADFLRRLHGFAPGLVRVCVGVGWRFGHARGGDAGLLRSLGPELHFETTEVEPVEIDGRVVSSTLIRTAVETGDLETAHRYLGRRYSVLGTVIRGDGLGNQLGFPTANLSAHNEQFPPNGVYAVRGRWQGRAIPGVANIGIRPTMKTHGDRLLEVHLLDFAEDLYGRDLEVEFLRFLRPEQKFPDVDSLRAQIARDVESARAVFP